MLKVRLDDYEVEAAIKCFKRHFLEGDKLWLFEPWSTGVRLV